MSRKDEGDLSIFCGGSLIIEKPTHNLQIVGHVAKWLKGRATLEGTGEWQTVTDENKADMRFFKVEVP